MLDRALIEASNFLLTDGGLVLLGVLSGLAGVIVGLLAFGLGQGGER